jgi:hypothetical protein
LVLINHIHKKNKQEVLLVEWEWSPRTQVILPFFMTMDGIFIPKEILQVEELSFTEKGVLALYKYYTKNGKNKCCTLTKPQIAEELGISVVYMKKIKRHLTELGLIKSSGIKVFYVGIKGDTIVSTNNKQGDTIVPTWGYQSTHRGIPEYPQGDTIVSTKGIPEYPHKEEKKEKEIKKEEKWVTNIKLLFARLPKDYQTPERLNYIKDTYKDRLNEVDFNEGGIIDGWVTNIKNELNKAFHIDFVIPKQEKKSDFIDMF